MTFAARGDTPRTPLFFFYFIFILTTQDAKDAEKFFLFFAVDPPKIPVDRKDGKE